MNFSAQPSALLEVPLERNITVVWLVHAVVARGGGVIILIGLDATTGVALDATLALLAICLAPQLDLVVKREKSLGVTTLVGALDILATWPALEELDRTCLAFLESLVLDL